MKKFTPLLFVALLISCNKNDSGCGGDDKLRNTFFPTMTPSVFSQYITAVFSGDSDINYQTGYHNFGSRSTFAFFTTVQYVCPYESVTVSPYTLLKNADSSIVDTLKIVTSDNILTSEAILPSNGKLFKEDKQVSFGLKISASYSISNEISIPYQGSAAADSIYFFNNLDSLSLNTRYKTER